MEKKAILFWNEVALQALANDHTGEPPNPEQGGPAFSSRALAIIHAAMYDAANSFFRTKKPYFRQVDGITSVEAAIAGAAYATLINLYRNQKAYISERLEFFGINDTESFEIGKNLGESFYEFRKDDGSSLSRMHAPEALFPNTSLNIKANSIPEPKPGEHQPDPKNPDQGLYAVKWGSVQPFVIEGLTTEIISHDFPSLESKEYAEAFTEVLDKGKMEGTSRTMEELEIGLFWAYDGANKIGTPPRLYNQVARQIAETLNFSEDENASFFALINLALADAGIHTWHAKYKYNLWRPIIGIRNALAGGGDVSWLPYGSPSTNVVGKKNFTPPFPAYPSGHATFGSASFNIMKLFLNSRYEEMGVQDFNINEFKIRNFVSDELNGKSIDNITGIERPLSPRTFTLDEAIKENLVSRIYLGVHWRFDGSEGERVGSEIASRVFKEVAVPEKLSI